MLDRLEDIEHARYLALVQVIIDKEEGVKAFESYMQIAFPSLAHRKKLRDEEVKKVLDWWVKKGPMRVTPLTPPTLHSKLKSRVARVNTDADANRLYRGLGDPLGGAWRSQNQREPSTYAPIAGVRR